MSSRSTAAARPALTQYEQTAAQISYYANKNNLLATTSAPGTSGSPWSTFSTASASGGSYARTTSSTATVVIPFNGTQLNVVATKGTTLGKMDVSVDGGAPVTVDLANATTQYQQTVFTTGTLARRHALGADDARTPPRHRGQYISLDRVDVAGTLVAVTKNEQTNATAAPMCRTRGLTLQHHVGLRRQLRSLDHAAA